MAVLTSCVCVSADQVEVPIRSRPSSEQVLVGILMPLYPATLDQVRQADVWIHYGCWSTLCAPEGTDIHAHTCTAMDGAHEPTHPHHP